MLQQLNVLYFSRLQLVRCKLEVQPEHHESVKSLGKGNKSESGLKISISCSKLKKKKNLADC